MKSCTFVVAFCLVNKLNAQKIDREYIADWLKATDSTINVKEVVKYGIDDKSYFLTDSAELDKKLDQIQASRVKAITYSKYKSDEIVPGQGTIYIMTIRKLSVKTAGAWLTEAKDQFMDSYPSFSNHIYENAKDPVLIIDGQFIHHTEVKTRLNNLDPKEIYDIDVNQSAVPATVYGQNAKNGLVQIWTNQYMMR